MNVYLAGPLFEGHGANYPLFRHAAKAIRNGGYMVYNPLEYVEDVGDRFTMRGACGEFCSFICAAADAVVALPGWETSKGATSEVLLAQQIGLPIMYHDGERFVEAHAAFSRPRGFFD